MASNIPLVVDEIIRTGIIGQEQKQEVIDLFSEMQKAMQSSDGYKMMEPLKKKIPETMLQMTKDITYEDAMVLTFAVQASNVKKAGRFFGSA